MDVSIIKHLFSTSLQTTISGSLRLRETDLTLLSNQISIIYGSRTLALVVSIHFFFFLLLFSGKFANLCCNVREKYTEPLRYQQAV